MSIWKKMKNYLTDLYYWRTERTLLRENCNELREEAAKLRDMNRRMCAENDRLVNENERLVAENPYEEAMDALVKENEELTKLLDGYAEELLHQRDLNSCLWEDWGKKHTECAIATKKLQDKDDAEYRTWAEHKLLLAALIMTEPEEAAKFHA